MTIKTSATSDMEYQQHATIPIATKLLTVALVMCVVDSHTAVKNWPTPTACAAKGSSPASLTRKNGKSRVNDRLDHNVLSTDGGQLNPDWVEWLMCWPTGWTSLEPLDRSVFEAWQQNIATHWHAEPANVPRVISGMAFRGDRLKAIGNGQVSRVAAAAWRILGE